ncbi:autotransporter assembly complex protein TamA [Psittacicella hinzii]|uniref:autotransporter assembly complex protein TamA n=1 Tax=Psittacicella hinzii TaxID=2028575 RepID=UPI0036D2AA29
MVKSLGSLLLPLATSGMLVATSMELAAADTAATNTNSGTTTSSPNTANTTTSTSTSYSASNASATNAGASNSSVSNTNSSNTNANANTNNTSTSEVTNASNVAATNAANNTVADTNAASTTVVNANGTTAIDEQATHLFPHLSLPSNVLTYEQRGLFISTQGNKTTISSAATPEQFEIPTLSASYNSLAALKYYLKRNNIRHASQAAYPQTLQLQNTILKAAAICLVKQQQDNPALTAFVEQATTKSVSISNYQELEQRIAQQSTDEYQQYYDQLDKLPKKLDTEALENLLQSSCVINYLSTQAPALDAKAFFAEQEKAPSFLQWLKAYYRSLFVTYYTPDLQYGQRSPLVFTNKTSEQATAIPPEYYQYMDDSVLVSGQSFTVTSENGFKVKVSGVGNSELQEQAGNNVYADIAINIKNAINTINPMNIDGSLRHQMTVQKLVTNAAYGYGFYDVQVTTTRVNSKEFAVRVVLGKPLKVTDSSQVVLRGEGNGLTTLYPVAQNITEPGRLFSVPTYNSVKGNLVDIAQENGYLDAKFETAQVLVNREQKTATWNLDFNTGERYRIGTVTINGGPLDHRVTYYMAGLKVGSAYSQTEVSRSIARLQASKNFDVVDVQTTVNNQARTVDVTYNLTKGKPNNLEYSLGYDTTEGVRTQASYERYYLNRWGGSASASGYLSKLTQRFEVNYKHPYLYRPNEVFFNVGLYYERAYQTDLLYYSKSVVGYLNYSRLSFQNWQFSASLYARRDYWELSNEKIKQDIQYSEFIFARKGLTTDVSLTLRSTLGLEKLFKSVGYHAILFKAEHTFQLSEKNGLLLSVRLGKIDSNRFNYLAPALRLYSGGATSIRGYGYQSISSYKGEEDVGANKQAEFTVEYLRTLMPSLKGALFVDGGNSSDNIRLNNLYYGAGVGVRYYLPVGYAKFDIAYPLQKGFSWSKIAFYLGISASF